MCHSGGYFPLPRIVVDKTAQEMEIEDSLDAELIYREDFAEEGTAVWQAAWIPRPVSPDVRDSA